MLLFWCYYDYFLYKIIVIIKKEHLISGLGEVDENWFDKTNEETCILRNEELLSQENAQSTLEIKISDLQPQSLQLDFKTPYTPQSATVSFCSPILFSPNGASQQVQGV